MNNLEYLENHLRNSIQDLLDKYKYYPANSDWEFSENTYYNTLNDIFEAVLEEKPDIIWVYVRDYLKANHEFEITI